MDDLGRNIFWAFFTELLFVILAIVLKDDKRKVVTVLVFGTLIAGSVWFFLPPSNTVSDDTVNNTTRIDYATTDHNIVENGKAGMKIYVTFRVVDKKGVPCRVYVRFFDEAENPLQDTNNQYARPNGQVSVGEDFTPDTNNSLYENLVLFIPYEELHLTGEGRHALKFDVVLYNYQQDAIMGYSESIPLEIMLEAKSK